MLALVALVAGCTGPGVRVSGPGSGEDGSALPAASEFVGTWRGFYWQLGMVYYLDDADCTLEIKEDRAFTATCKRSPVGANNIAKSSTWSGRAVIENDRIVLDDEAGSWPSIVLRRSADDSLFGTTLDPLVGATIEMEFQRAPHRTAGTDGK
jgi:hypothetical protein